MAGLDQEYRGEAALAPGASVGMLEQEPHLDESKDVKGNVEDGVAETRALLDRFNELAANYSDENADEFSRIQARISTTSRPGANHFLRAREHSPSPPKVRL